MKALVYTNPNEVQLQERPYPTVAEGEVVLEIDAVGICGSDMHAYHGHDPRRKPGLVLGHEFAGTVVDGPGKGRRVTGNPLITCGTCDYCVQGRDNLCSNRTLLGAYTYSTADRRATVQALHRGVFGDVSWVEERRLDQGAAAFADLHNGRTAAAKVVLRPH